MSAQIINIASRRPDRIKRMREHGHAVSDDGRDYGHEHCPRCGGATYTGRQTVCPICGAIACVCHNGKRMTLDEFLEQFEYTDPSGAA